MSVEIRLSSKGQVVIPKDVREALDLFPGSILHLSREGRRIVIEAGELRPSRPGITYEEFRRRVPKYEGPPASAEEMTANVGELFRDWKG